MNEKYLILKDRSEKPLRYLDTYGPTEGEIEWIESRSRALGGSLNCQMRRMVVLQEMGFTKIELEAI